MSITGLDENETGLRVREDHALPAGSVAKDPIGTSLEYRLRIDGRGLVQVVRTDEIVLIGAPLRVNATWTRSIQCYAPEAGWSSETLTCRIAMIHTVPILGDSRLTLRVMGHARLALGEVTLTEQYADGVGLVLRREH